MALRTRGSLRLAVATVYTIDGLGNTQQTYYDAADRVAGTRSYATPLALSAALKTKLDAGTAKLTDISGVLVATDGKDLRSYQVFDAAGRVRYVLDAYGAVTESVLDAAGRTVGVRREGDQYFDQGVDGHPEIGSFAQVVFE